MSWTKRQIVESAFDEIGMAVYTFDIQPEQMQSVLNKLDLMMGTWNGKGLRLGYPLPSSQGSSSLDSDSGIPDHALNAVVLNLAIRIAPSFGKNLSPATAKDAKSAYRAVLAQSTQPKEMQLPGTMPRGAGNKPWIGDRRKFVTEPDGGIAIGDDGDLEF